MTPRLWQKEELKSLLMKQEHEKVGIKVNIHKTKIMASGPITPWQIDGETVETLADFIFLGSVITADGDFRHEIKRHLLLGRKTMTKLNNILKSRDITLATKVCLVKIMFFSSSHGWLWESIKKAECQRIGAFELWCWRRLLGIPWTARIFNQSIIKEISPEYSLEGLNIHWKDWCWSWSPNTLATWYKELTHWNRPWCWERLKVGGEGDDRGWGGWMSSLTEWTWAWASYGSWWWTSKPGVLSSMGSQRVGHAWVTELNWVILSIMSTVTVLQHLCLNNPYFI